MFAQARPSMFAGPLLVLRTPDTRREKFGLEDELPWYPQDEKKPFKDEYTLYCFFPQRFYSL